MSPKVPKAYLDARRAEIIDAAFRCFGEKGFHNSTMQDIYKETKLSPGAVYNYFSSKEDIASDTVKVYTDRMLHTLSSMISEDPDESFFKYFRLLFSDLEKSDTARKFSSYLEFYAEATRNNKIREIIIKSMNATGDKLAGPVNRQQRAGLFNPKLDPAMIGHVMVGMIWAAAIHKMIEPDFDLAGFRQVCEAMFEGTFAKTPVKTKKTGQLNAKLRKAEKEYSKRHPI